MSSVDALGKTILKIKNSLFYRVALGMSLLTFTAAMVVICVQFYLLDKPVNSMLIYLSLGILTALWCVAIWVKRFEFREHGLMSRNLFGTKMLLYRDIYSFSYRIVDHYVNGVHGGRRFHLTFMQKQGQGKSIGVVHQTRKGDVDFERMVHSVSVMVAANLDHELSEHGIVRWTPGVELSHQGIRFREQKFLSKGEPVFVSFNDIYQYNLTEDGRFLLWVSGSPQPILDLNCAAPNFYPGFVLFKRLTQSRFPDNV